MSGERTVLVDASAFITLAGIGRTQLLKEISGDIRVTATVAEEIKDEPASIALEEAHEWLEIQGGVRGLSTVTKEGEEAYDQAAAHLGIDPPEAEWSGDLSLLSIAIKWLEEGGQVLIITDDKPLRKTCKALGIPISGSIGVLIAAVERGDIDPEEAKHALVAMDEVGARLSARLLRKAERLIDEAAERVEE